LDLYPDLLHHPDVNHGDLVSDVYPRSRKTTGLPVNECAHARHATARCRVQARADNRVVAEGEDWYLIRDDGFTRGAPRDMVGGNHDLSGQGIAADSNSAPKLINQGLQEAEQSCKAEKNFLIHTHRDRADCSRYSKHNVPIFFYSMCGWNIACSSCLLSGMLNPLVWHRAVLDH
jgi:hypothetical protein